MGCKRGINAPFMKTIQQRTERTSSLSQGKANQEPVLLVFLQNILVKKKEIQFFLWGAFQNELTGGIIITWYICIYLHQRELLFFQHWKKYNSNNMWLRP